MKEEAMLFYGTASAQFVDGCVARDISVLHVCGIFSSSAYLSGEKNEIVLLHDEQYGLVPFGIGIPQIRHFLNSARLTPHMEGRLRKTSLEFTDTGVKIQISPAALLRQPGKCPTEGELDTAVKRGQAYLAAYGKGAVWTLALEVSAVPGNIFTMIAQKTLPRFCTALRHCDKSGVSAALESLLGLGQGLTPSMDDFLTGLVYTLLFACRNWGTSLPEAELLAGELCRLAPKKTGIFSAAYLCSASRGLEFTLFEEVLRGEPVMLSDKAVAALQKVGSSSGEDMLTGIVYALKYIISSNVNNR